jgi:hypothetical protein
VVAGADLGQRAGDRLPAVGCDRQQLVAGRHEVSDRQFPGKFSRVAGSSAPDALLDSSRIRRPGFPVGCVPISADDTAFGFHCGSRAPGIGR